MDFLKLDTFRLNLWLKQIVVLSGLLLLPFLAFSWGFYAHKQINKMAIFTLPLEMAGFYKQNINYIEENAVLPDKRRYIIKEEGARHFLDMDYYQDSLGLKLPMVWNEFDSLISDEVKLKHGILPWHLGLMKWKLKEAFETRNQDAILKISADIGHYIADAHVPLHTCSNYNGQLTNQHGIHGLWESRLPEIFSSDYSYWVGPATYVENTNERFWSVVFSSHQKVDSVLKMEKWLSDNFPQDQKYAFEQRGAAVVKVYSKEFCSKYSELLNGQIEERMRSAIQLIGSIWYTCWVDAGKPGFNFGQDITSANTIENEENNVILESDCNGH